MFFIPHYKQRFSKKSPAQYTNENVKLFELKFFMSRQKMYNF